LGVKASNPIVLLANLANSTERFIAATASTSGPNKLGMGAWVQAPKICAQNTAGDTYAIQSVSGSEIVI